MSDISKCNDALCPSKEICYRFTAPTSEFRQAYINTNREGDAYNCDFFWQLRQRKSDNINEFKKKMI